MTESPDRAPAIVEELTRLLAASGISTDDEILKVTETDAYTHMHGAHCDIFVAKGPDSDLRVTLRDGSHVTLSSRTSTVPMFIDFNRG